MNEYGLLRVRDIREKLSKILGREVTCHDWKQFQRHGLAPFARGRTKWDGCWSEEEAEDIIMAIITGLRTGRRRVDYWDLGEVCEEIERRLGIPMPVWRRDHFRDLGLLKGDIRSPGHHEWYYSDLRVEEVIARISAVVIESGTFKPGRKKKSKLPDDEAGL